jgi:hypothetical protein
VETLASAERRFEATTAEVGLAAADIILPKVLPLRKVHVATRKKLVSERN